MVENVACSPGVAGSIPGLERAPGGGLGSSLQHACLQNPVDRAACGYSPGVTESPTAGATRLAGMQKQIREQSENSAQEQGPQLIISDSVRGQHFP